MPDQKAITFTLAVDLAAKASEAAQAQNQSLSDFIALTVERHVLALKNHETVMRLGLEQGKRLGITCDEDVERMADEWTAEQRAAH